MPFIWGEAVQNLACRNKIFRVYFHFTLFVICLLLSACGSEGNHPPTADSGPNIIAVLNDRITLTGEASSDVDGDALTYVWEIVERPEFSDSSLDNPKSLSPALLIDKDGVYKLKLIVSDGQSFSAADFLTITTINDLPVAKMLDVTPDKSATYYVGDTIQLDASDSYDPERQDLIYYWDIILQPELSVAELEEANTSNIQFTVDSAGVYIIHLIVDDGVNQSIPATIIITALAAKNKPPSVPDRVTSTKPVAEAGPDQPLYEAAMLIQLDGSASTDADNDHLSYEWKFLIKPENSRTELSDPTSERPLFTTDILSSYVLQLTVIGGIDGRSLLDTIVITPHFNDKEEKEENAKLACQDCHNSEISKGKPENHLLTYDDCGSCHSTTKFQPNIKTFHPHGDKAKPFVCDVCHNGFDATGKSDTHIITDLDCNACHTISEESWLPAEQAPKQPGFDHQGIVTGCISCHNGVNQAGKPDGHIPSSNRCYACHFEFSGWLPAKSIEHTRALAPCSLCHDDKKEEKIKPKNHLITTDNCLVCHDEATWLPVKMNHDETFGICLDCHAGKFPLYHIPTTIFCGKCHNVFNWEAPKVDHSSVLGRCLNCHVSREGAVDSMHSAISHECDACHTTEMWKPIRIWDHQHAIGECIRCHDGVIAVGKMKSHMNTTDLCDACHLISSFKQGIKVEHD